MSWWHPAHVGHAVRGKLADVGQGTRLFVQLLRLLGTAPAEPLRVTYRQGGECINIAGRGSRDLKRLLNESGLPAFVRGRVPLLLCGERVLAVANLPGLDGAAQGDWQLHWQPPTSDQDLS